MNKKPARRPSLAAAARVALNAERQAILARAVTAGVRSARARGKNLIELDAEDLGRLVDRAERYRALLETILPQAGDALPDATVKNIGEALAGR